MTPVPRPVLVFDVLGTLVDQGGSLVAEVRVAAPDVDAPRVVATWLARVGEQEGAVLAGRRSFAPSHELDHEVLAGLAGEGALPAVAVDRLATAAERLRPWPDSAEGVALLARDFTVLGLSNASRRTLEALGVGLAWHGTVSAEDAGTYKPAPALYAAAVVSAGEASATGHAADHAARPGAVEPVMVAAHAWDLRAAACAGMRTAYVPRPQGDAPRADDAFDLHAADLADLHARLLAGGLGPQLS
ncbi:HAD-IA family hydrolase [Krasilnikoviella flava]|uniref:2-haloacid dehalogenase n=1 Tax=Krasilnikoviella flava TaxID=526729 RepID=A0A1T5KTD0_9MICO|nr:HAD-IA family hydrolase [Krasilnikoviella flava]SKC66903.1 2-haloacid dehalogenase [Krasilnikoviella flava]